MLTIDTMTAGGEEIPLRQSGCVASGRTLYAVRLHSGWKLLDSPYRPVEESREAVAALGGDAVSVFVLGLGSGFLARELLGLGLQRLLLVTPSMAIARCNAKVLEPGLPATAACRILVADRMTAPAVAVIDLFLEENPDAHILLHPRETKIFYDFFEHLRLHVAARGTAHTRSGPTAVRRVLFPCAGQLLEPDICAVLQRRGIEVRLVPSLSNRTVQHRDVLHTLLDSQPDLVLSTNNRGSDRYGLMPGACSMLRIPWATWFLDQPEFTVSPSEGTQGQLRTAYCWDANGMDACRGLGFTRTVALPLAGNPAVFSPGPGDPSLRGRIVYVGSPGFGNEDSYFAALCKDSHALAIAADLEGLVRKKRILPAPQDILDRMAARALRPDYFPALSLERMPAFVLYRANTAYRAQALSSLADLRPVVYGRGWNGLVPATVELRCPVDYYRELASVYRSDALHLSLTHLQMRHYPNQRIFDAGLCGRAVLGERLPGTEELFGTHLHELHFTDLAHMREQAERLMHDSRLRHRLGEHVRDIVSVRHTLDRRIELILDQAVRA